MHRLSIVQNLLHISNVICRLVFYRIKKYKSESNQSAQLYFIDQNSLQSCNSIYRLEFSKIKTYNSKYIIVKI